MVAESNWEYLSFILPPITYQILKQALQILLLWLKSNDRPIILQSKARIISQIGTYIDELLHLGEQFNIISVSSTSKFPVRIAS